MTNKIDTLCERTKIRLIAAAVAHQQCTATDGTEVPLPGTGKRILIGDDAYLARVATPAGIATGAADLDQYTVLAELFSAASKYKAAIESDTLGEQNEEDLEEALADAEHWLFTHIAPSPQIGQPEQIGQDERALFETDARALGIPLDGHGDGHYSNIRTRNRWLGWQARAVLAHPSEHAPAEQEQTFAQWLAKEMPAGTVIGDPTWWASRIFRAAASQAAPVWYPVQWLECERIANIEAVNEALLGFSEDPTGDNGTCVVRAVLEAIGGVPVPAAAPAIGQAPTAEPEGWRAFIENCSRCGGGMVNGNRLAIVAKELLVSTPAGPSRAASTAEVDDTAKEALRNLSHIENYLESSDAPTTIKNRAVDVRLCIKELRAALQPSRAAIGADARDA